MEWFEIIDVEEFVNNTRVLTYNLFEGLYDEPKLFDVKNISYDFEELTEEEKEELDSILSISECITMSENFMTKRGSEYTINGDEYINMVECFNRRLISNMVQKLAQRGLLEIAFDDEKNDFIFWVNKNGKD